jgi:hypothetical protein
LEAAFCFLLQVEKAGRWQKAYLLGHVVELASDLARSVNWHMCLMHFVSCRQKLLLFCIWSLLVFWPVSRWLVSLCWCYIRPSYNLFNLLFVQNLNKQIYFANISISLDLYSFLSSPSNSGSSRCTWVLEKFQNLFKSTVI